MGYDISNHPVDVRLIQDHIIPFIQARRDDIDSLMDRATQLAQIANRANRWAHGMADVDSEIRRRQNALAQEDSKPLLGVMPPAGNAPQDPARRIHGIPGFDSDLLVWGRPFFIVADSCDEALQEFDAYLSLPSADTEAVDRIARRMLTKLDHRRAELAPQIQPADAGILDAFYPLNGHVLPDSRGDAFDPAAFASTWSDRLERLRTIYGKRHTDELILCPDGEDYPASELMASFPLEIVDIAASVLPGWTGRGYVWPTALFEQIGVDIRHIFEPPAWLFEALIREAPPVADALDVTINENYSLGGSVRPEKVPALLDLLHQHRERLIGAWMDTPVNSEELDSLSADFDKILEPAVYAARHGFGFIEACEIYSI